MFYILICLRVSAIALVTHAAAQSIPTRRYKTTALNRFQPTVDCLDASAVIVWELEVFRLKPLVEGSHDGRGVVRVLQAQSMTELMDGHQKDIVTFM